MASTSDARNAAAHFSTTCNASSSGPANAGPAKTVATTSVPMNERTGTSNDASDGWYVGITRDLVSGAWVGGDERSIRYRDWALGQGGRTARPIWEKYMLKVYADRSVNYKKGEFRRPANGLDISMECPDDDDSFADPAYEPNN